MKGLSVLSWLLLWLLFLGALALNYLAGALTIFQIRSSLGIAPAAAMNFSSLATWLSQILLVVAIIGVYRKTDE